MKAKSSTKAKTASAKRATKTPRAAADLEVSPFREDPETDAFISRNRSAINKSIREGRKALARGDFWEGTPDELTKRVLAEANRRRAAKAR